MPFGHSSIEESRTDETYLEVVEGIQFDRGYKSPYFVTDNNTMSTPARINSSVISGVTTLPAINKTFG